MKIDKITRVLYLYNLLRDGIRVNKSTFSLDYEVSERGFDRDIQDIRLMLSDMGIYDEVVYDKSDNAYYMTGQENHHLDETDAFIFAKLLLDSKGFRKDETDELLENLIKATDKHKKKLLSKKLEADMEHYEAASHNQPIVKLIQDLSNCIMTEKQISLSYNGKDYRVKPQSITFEKSGVVLNTADADKKEVKFLIEKIIYFKII